MDDQTNAGVPKRRTHRVDGVVLKAKREEKRWEPAQLARKAGCSEKTILNIETRGVKEVFETNLLAIAKALSVDPLSLLAEASVDVSEDVSTVVKPVPEAPIVSRRDRRFPLKLTVGIPPAEFHASERLLTFLTMLKNIIHSTGEISILCRDKRTSTLLVEMSRQDILRLLAGLMDGTLQRSTDIMLVKVEFPNYRWIQRMIVALDQIGRPVEVDDEMWLIWMADRIAETVLKYQYGFELRLMSWGNGSRVPTSGETLVIVGIDHVGLLHIRIFDDAGIRTKDTDERKLPDQAAAIATLKQKLPGLLPPYELTDAEESRIIAEVTSIVGHPQMHP